MKRLSLEELKAQAAEKEKLGQNVEINLEAIKGGDVDWCHLWDTFVGGVIQGLTQQK